MSDWIGGVWGTVRQSRFLVQDPEQLWAMVEPADGATVSGLGDLLTDAAKTIKEIGDDLRTHSSAVEWDGEGGDAFRKWCHQAALATLSLGDYSENAGKWLGHAADTLHEVRPQVEILRNQSAGARSVLDAHAAKAADVGSHGGGPSDSEVAEARTQYANFGVEAGGLMMKLAQSYTASTEQIDALEAPRFPELPKRFVPDIREGETHIAAPATEGGLPQWGLAQTETPKRQAASASSASGMTSGTSMTSEVSLPPRPTDQADVSGLSQQSHEDVTNMAVDGVGSLPPSQVIPSSPSTSPAGPSGPDGRTPPTAGLLPPAFGTGPTPLPGVRGGGERQAYGYRAPLPTGGRAPLPTPSGPGTSAGPRIPGRGLPGPFGPGGQPVAGRGPAGSPAARGVNGVTGGRTVPPTAGRPTGAIAHGNVVGRTPNQQQPPRGRGGVPASPAIGATSPRGERPATKREGATGGRMPSSGIVGGQPRPARGRGRAGFVSRDAGAVGEAAMNEERSPRGGASRDRGASTASTSTPNRNNRTSSRDNRAARNRRSDPAAADMAEERDGQAEELESRRVPPSLPKGPDGDLGRGQGQGRDV
jgi:hypothetical protein